MILSVWRKAHLLFAITTSFFLLILSVTGVILSFSPISNTLSDYHIKNASSIKVADVITILEKKYEEVFELNITENNFLKISVITLEGNFESFYADPKTGEKLGDIEEEPFIFSFSRILHRSLYAGSIGRALVGIVAFLLLLIVLSGIALVVKRQLGIKQFFSKVTKENPYQYSHILVSRFFLFFILIICLSGIYLSLRHFDFITSKTIYHEMNENHLAIAQTPLSHSLFSIFSETSLSELQALQFPFSTSPEDYFQMRLNHQELAINQFNGEVMSKISVDLSHQLYQLMFDWHTGSGSVFWSIILSLATLSIPFFLFTGFKMTWDRRKGNKKNMHPKEKSEFIILVGSEGGTTLLYAKQLQQLLLQNDQKVFLDDLNNYTEYDKIKHLIIFTSTYGQGEAPDRRAHV